MPLFTSPSVNKDTTDSHGPYFLGGVLQAIGDNIAILIIKPPKILKEAHNILHCHDLEDNEEHEAYIPEEFK